MCWCHVCIELLDKISYLQGLTREIKDCRETINFSNVSSSGSVYGEGRVKSINCILALTTPVSNVIKISI
jgi:hypothetical protein